MGSADNLTDKVLSPSAFVHIVLRTTPTNFRPVAEYYKTFLGAYASYENDFFSFLTYDEEHHRIAIIGVEDTGPKQAKTCGLEHFAFSYATLKDLTLSYRQRKARGMLPYWCVNHGPTTSIYYKDPDGNKIETQVDNMDNDDATAFMMSKSFAENPFGVDFDPEELIRRLDAGEDEKVLKVRPEIGPRGPPEHI